MQQGWLRRRGTAADEGFGLVEAVVAAMLLALFSAGIGGLILSSLKVSKIDRQRVAATNLAAREMEITRNEFGRSDAAALAVVGAGLVLNPNSLDGSGPSTVDGVAYTISRTASWQPAGTGVSACDGGGAVQYPSVSVVVTVVWDGMRGIKPVTVASVVTPNKTVLNGTYAFVAAKVSSFAAVPLAGRTVRLTGPSGPLSEVTDASGCAVFGLPTAGAHVFSLQETGYVDYQSAQLASKPVPVSAGSFQQIAFTWDREATVQALVTTASGYALPSPLPDLVVANNNLPTPGRRTFTNTGQPTMLGLLGPYADGYTLWAGTCPDANPVGPPTNTSLTPVIVTPGTTTSASAYLAPLSVLTVLPLMTVTATHDGACSPTLTLGTTGVDGALKTSLPYGEWTVTVGGLSKTVTPSGSDVTEVTIP